MVEIGGRRRAGGVPVSIVPGIGVGVAGDCIDKDCSQNDIRPRVGGVRRSPARTWRMAQVFGKQTHQWRRWDKDESFVKRAIVVGTRTKSGSTDFLRLMGENAGAQVHTSTAAQSASAGKKRTTRSARSFEAQKPEFSEAARSLAAKY